MNAEIQKKADRLKTGLRPDEVVAYNRKNGRVSVFLTSVTNPASNLKRFGWEIIHTYAPPGIKPVTPVERPAGSVEAKKPGRKPKEQ